MYGYQESSELSTQSGKFGLNQGAVVSKFAYNPNAGKDGALQDAIDFTAKLGEREYMMRFFPVSKVFAKSGGELTDTNSQDYKDEMAKAVAQLNATLSDIVKCFVTAEDLKQALLTPISSFKDYAEILQRLVQSVPNWDTMPVDVFLHYQWSPKGDNTKTFVELPKNVKHGLFICKAQVGEFTEDRTGTHIKYVTAEGTVHPFKRGQWFVGSAFANETNIGGASAPAASGMNAAPGAATAANW